MLSVLFCGIIIDIRRPAEWEATGIPAKALPITIHDPAGQQAFLEKILKAVGGDKAVPIALICASGRRSAWASRFLEERGFSRLYNIK